jgi:hypothetical protein
MIVIWWAKTNILEKSRKNLLNDRKEVRLKIEDQKTKRKEGRTKALNKDN